MQRNCAWCGKSFEFKKPQATYCSGSCRATAAKERKAGPRAEPTAAPAPQRAVSGLVDSVLAELEVLGKVDSADGQLALELAGRIVSAPGMNTGVAALSKELSRVRAEVRASSTATVDLVDELAKRRDEKRKRAAG